MVNLASPLPPLYARWMHGFLNAPLPVEVRATCEDCQMAPPHSGRCGNDVVFRADSKCCTFWPELPNFLVGAVLSDASAEFAAGREVFERNAESRAVINPLGVFPTSAYSTSFRYNANNFGDRESFLCPYFMREEGGLCGIWRYRNGRCSTWFCKHERGSLSVLFWNQLDQLLAAVEASLAKWCLLEMDFPAQALATLIPASFNPVPGSRAVWDLWTGREREFFKECWKRVEALTWNQISEILGPEEHALARLTEVAFRNLRLKRIPERLRCGQWTVEPLEPGRSRVWTYSRFDPMDLDDALLESLSLFDGSPTSETLIRIQTDRGIRLHNDLLQKLCDVQILVEDV